MSARDPELWPLLRYLVECAERGLLPGPGSMREQDPDEIEALGVVEGEREAWMAEVRRRARR